MEKWKEHMEDVTHELTVNPDLALSATSPESLAKIDLLQGLLLDTPQLPLETAHVLHAGVYARTIRMPAETVLTGALIKIPTLLVVSGVANVWTDQGWLRLSRYTVLPGMAGRKQIFVARTAVDMTMMFPTQAKTVDEAEREFTDEYELLMSRRQSSPDPVLVTGE